MKRRFLFLRWWLADRRAPSEPMPTNSETPLIVGSGLFDERFYLVEAPGGLTAGFGPIAHFIGDGWRQGRRPNPYFDPLWYRDRYLSDRPDTNPLVHYITGGEAEGCRPICFFDPAWYRRAYELTASQAPLRHYLLNRHRGRYAPNSHFDLAFYVSRYGEEIGPNDDPFAHLLRHGADRDLDPSPHFDSATYRRLSMSSDRITRRSMAARERRIPFIHALDALHPEP